MPFVSINSNIPAARRIEVSFDVTTRNANAAAPSSARVAFGNAAAQNGNAIATIGSGVTMPGGSIVYSCAADFDPADSAGVVPDEIFFQCFQTDNQGEEASQVSVIPYAPPLLPAKKVHASSNLQEIPLQGGSADITAFATQADGSTAVPGRPVVFGFKTGSSHGTFDKPMPVLTGTDGKARVKFTPSQPGQAHIEAAVDGLTDSLRVKVRN